MKQRAILVADADPRVRRRWRAGFDATDDFIVRAAVDPAEAASATACLTPEVVLLGIDASGPTDIETITALHCQTPPPIVIILARQPDAGGLIAAVQAGAFGYLDNDLPMEAIIAAVRLALRGEPPMAAGIALEAVRKLARVNATDAPSLALRQLTARQAEILRIIAEGKTNKEIAHVLGLSEQTIANHVKAILQRLDVHKRTDAAWVLRDRSQELA